MSGYKAPAPSVEERLRRVFRNLTMVRAALASEEEVVSLDDLLDATGTVLDEAISDVFNLRHLPPEVLDTKSPEQ